MLGGLKSSLAFAGVILVGAAILAANFGTTQASSSRANGGYNDAEYVPPSEVEMAPAQDEAYETLGDEGAGQFASDEELVDATSGFDPSAEIISSDGAYQASEGSGSSEQSSVTGESDSSDDAVDM